MRRRRLERLVSRAEEAISRGQTDEVADALEEVRRLAPESEQIATLEQALAASRSREPREPVDAAADVDLPLASMSAELGRANRERIRPSRTFRPASTGRTQKALVAVGSLMVAAAGLLVWSIYTAPEEQLRGLFPSLADNRTAPPEVPKGQPATPVDKQASAPSARVRVETVEAAAVQPRTTEAAQEQPDGTTGPPAPASSAPPRSRRPAPAESPNLPTGTSGAPSAPPPPAPQRADASVGAATDRAMPAPVGDVPAERRQKRTRMPLPPCLSPTRRSRENGRAERGGRIRRGARRPEQIRHGVQPAGRRRRAGSLARRSTGRR